MSKLAPTLADAVIRERLRGRWDRVDPGQWFPKKVAEARKFVLDDKMSAFMADLAYASLEACSSQYKSELLMDSMRMSARAPFPTTWIEYAFRPRAERAVAEYKANMKLGKDDLPDRNGWLVLQHPQLDTAFMAIECSSHAWDKEKGAFAKRLDMPNVTPVGW